MIGLPTLHDRLIMSVASNTSTDSSFFRMFYYNEMAKRYKIRHTMWCAEDVDMESLHPFTATHVVSSCRCSPNGDPPKPIRGPKWIHVWRAIESYYKQLLCDHCFIEIVTETNGYLDIHFGS